MSSTKSKLRLIGAFAALAALALAVSCRGFFVNPTVTSLAIGPANLSLQPSESFQMSATATYSDGSTSDVTGKALWVSSDLNVAVFPSPGLLTAVSLKQLEAQGTLPGTTNVQASIGTVTSSQQAVNVCPVVQQLAATINTATTYDGPSGDVTFDAKATFNGVSGQQDVVGAVTWTISNTTILASIGSDGTATLISGHNGTPFTVFASLCGTNSNTLTITTTN
jgi:hypothetical protein